MKKEAAIKSKLKKIRKRDGSIVPFKAAKIEVAILKAMRALGLPDKRLARSLTVEIVKRLETNIKSFKRSIPDIEQIQNTVEQILEEKNTRLFKCYSLYRRSRHLAREIREFFKIKDDLKFSANALKVLEERYLLKDEQGNIIETPSGMFRRVAKAVAAIDKKYKENAKKSEQTFFEAMKNLEFLPNSPTLFNAGTPYPMLSACFVLPINDDLVSIFTTLKNMAMIQQRGGGTGFSFSRLRPRGDIVRSTRGLASGPVSFIKVYDMATEVIKQGGCISADSLIRTDKGIVPLAEIADCPDFGDTPSKYLVYTNPKFEHAFLAENNGIAKVFNIQTEIGTNIKATYNHLIGIIDGKGNFAWKEAEKITKGDWIIHVLGGHCSEDQPLPRLNKVQHFNAKPIKIPEKISPEFAEILGIYVADGCISYDRLMFAIEDRDIELKKRIKKIMFNLFGLKGREERKPGENWINLIFQSKDLCDYFVKIGWKKENALNANIPQIIFRSSMESAYAFLRGLFEGDGSVHSDGFPILYSISKRLMKEVQQLLFGLGIVSTIHCYKVKNSYGKNLKYHLHIIQEKSVKEFIEKVGFISSRKNKKLVLKEKLIEPFDIIPNQGILLRKICAEKGKGCYHRPLYRSLQHYLSGIKENSKRNMPRKAIKKIIEKFNISHPQLRRMISDDYFYSRVSKISTEKDYTMDIMVPQAEHFVANSILVHNKRRGANMAILRCDHPDIEEFIISKQGKKQLSNFNISVAVTDRFMQAASQNKLFSLINPSVLIPPSKKVVKRVNAKALFDMACKAAWQTGDPGLIFIDEINRRQPTPELGLIEGTNPCSEVPLLPYESCNLGSINLSKFIKDGKMDWARLKQTVHLAVHFLDDVIDANHYPLPEIERITKANRKIGLGIMGFADVLIKLRVPYNSNKALNLAKQIMSFIVREARAASIALAKKRGSFPNFKKSIYKSKVPYLRNATCTTIAPTGSISIIAGCSSGIEPLFAIAYVREILEGKKLIEINPDFQLEAIKRGLYTDELIKKIILEGSIQKTKLPRDMKRIYITALEILPEWHIKMQAAFQPYVDNGISKTINMPERSAIADVKKIYMLAWKLKCKGITIYRYGSKPEQVLYLGKGKKLTKAELHYAGGSICAECAL